MSDEQENQGPPEIKDRRASGTSVIAKSVAHFTEFFANHERTEGVMDPEKIGEWAKAEFEKIRGELVPIILIDGIALDPSKQRDGDDPYRSLDDLEEHLRQGIRDYVAGFEGEDPLRDSVIGAAIITGYSIALTAINNKHPTVDQADLLIRIQQVATSLEYDPDSVELEEKIDPSAPNIQNVLDNDPFSEQ